MMKRAAIMTLYNPGNVGARYAAAALKAAGVETWLVHLKRFYTDPWVPKDDVEHVRRVEADPLKKVRFTFPGAYAYSPYPMPITEREKDLLAAWLRAREFDLIGISLYSVNVDLARDLTEWLRREVPGVSVLWGGVHPTVRPEECLEVADLVCLGEAERPLTELARRWEEWRRGEDVEIDGIWYRRNGRVARPPRPPLVTDLDDLPYPLYGENEVLVDDDRVDEETLSGLEFWSTGFNVVVLTGRGCPYSCNFCIYSVLHDLYKGQPRFRRRSVDNLIEEVEDRVSRLGLRHIIFHDEILCMQREWVREFSAKFRERFAARGVTFTGYVHPLTTDEESLDLLVQAGLTRTGIGMQTGSRYTSRDLYNRWHNPEKIVRLSKWLAKYDWSYLQVDLLVDNPYEREEHLRETLDVLLRLEPPFDVMCIGLVIYDECRLGQYPPPDFPYDEKMHLFYNMLFYLTGIADLDRKTIREWSNDPYLRAHPERLEEIAVAVRAMYNKKREAQKRLEDLQAQPEAIPSGGAAAVESGNGRALLRRLKRRVAAFLGR